jgi:hypothetical protein
MLNCMMVYTLRTSFSCNMLYLAAIARHSSLSVCCSTDTNIAAAPYSSATPLQLSPLPYNELTSTDNALNSNCIVTRG